MKVYVVDTNVPIVANGGDKVHADAHCQMACVEKLEYLVQCGIVAIDKLGLIFEEYLRNLSLAGTPGVGDAFFKYLYNNQHNCKRIERVEISQCDDEGIGFDELPMNDLDRSDRKFLAVAVVASATILNATDSDWGEQASLMESLGVDVCQLCPEYA